MILELPVAAAATNDTGETVRMDLRAQIEEMLLEVARLVNGATRDGVGADSLRADIMTQVRHLADAMPDAFDGDGAVVNAALVRLSWEFCEFVMQEFPALLTQGFEALELEPRYELDGHVPDIEYSYQNAWAAEHVLAIRPDHFVDVGSLTAFVTLVSRTVPCVAIDARPTPILLDNLTYQQGEAQALPLPDGLTPMLTSLHAPEHFGLGRYGDSIDNRGVERAIAEYLRVLAPGGHLAISMPIAHEPRIFFNSARVYTRELMLSLFDGCDVLDEVYLGSDHVSHDELVARARVGRIRSGVFCLLLRKAE